MFCRCRERLRRRAEHADVPGVPRVPRRAAGAEPARDRGDDQARPRARLRDRRAGGLPPEELLLSRQLPKAYQISQYDEPLCADGQLAVPTADGERRDRDHARAPRGGRGEERARRRVGPHPRCDRDARRLQPRRHAARRDRHRAGPPRRRDGEALPAAAAADGGRARPLGRGAREGLDALRRQRLRAPGGLGRAAHAHRAEEHELVQLRGEGDRARDRAADPDLRGGRHRRAGDAALRPDARGLAAAALEGGGAGLPLLPRARPRARCTRRRSSSSGCAARSASCRARGSGGSPTRSRSTTPTCSSPAGSTGSGPPSSRPAPTRRRRRTCSRTSSSRRASTRARSTRGELAKLVAARAEIPRAAFDEALAKAGEPGFSADPYLEQKVVADVGELDPVIDAIIAANPGQAEQYRGGKQGLLGFFVGQVMKETGGRADPRVVNERVRAMLG